MKCPLLVFAAVLAIPSAISAGPAKPLPLHAGVELASHRAVYDMKLSRAYPGSNVSALDGKLIIEFRGSPCEGYIQTTQIITNTADWNGKEVLTDLQSSSWEDANYERYSFHSKRYLNQQVSDVIEGDAVRENRKNAIKVALKLPVANNIRLGGETMFPTQHSLAILDAAMRGQFALQAQLYDGMDKGEKVYQTTTVIGKPLAPGANKSLKPVANADVLDNLVSWPVSISYFEGDKKSDILPSYQITYRLYANGVSRQLKIDYGNFSVDGELSHIEFLKPSECPAANNNKKR